MLMRKWGLLSTNEILRCQKYEFNLRSQSIAKVTLVVDYMSANSAPDTVNTDEMAKSFLAQFPQQALTVGQMVSHR